MSGAPSPAPSTGSDDQPEPPKNIWEWTFYWRSLGLGLYKRELKQSGNTQAGIEASRRAVFDHLLTIHRNVGYAPSFLPQVYKDRLTSWIDHLWDDIKPHLQLSAETSTERAKSLIKRLYLNYRRSWEQLGIHHIPNNAPYIAPGPRKASPKAIAGPSIAPGAPPPEAFGPPRLLGPGEPTPSPPSRDTGLSAILQQTTQNLPQWQTISPQVPPTAPRSAAERTAESLDWPQQANQQRGHLHNALNNVFGLFDRDHPIPHDRLHYFNTERHFLAQWWESWRNCVLDYLRFQHNNEEDWTFWEEKKAQNLLHDDDEEDSDLWEEPKAQQTVDSHNMTWRQHEDEKDSLEFIRSGLHDWEETLIRRSNMLIMELTRQVNAPRTDAGWQQRIAWEEFGFDFGNSNTMFNAYFEILLPSGEKVHHPVHERYRLHKLIADYRDPRSTSSNGMWVNSMKIRISKLRDALQRQGIFDPETQSLWFSRLPSDEAALQSPDSQIRITNDIMFIVDMQRLMLGWNPERLVGPRPIQGRHYIGGPEPEFTFLIRDLPDNYYEELVNQHVDSQYWADAEEHLHSAQLADQRSDSPARREHLLAAAGSYLQGVNSPNLNQQSEAEEEPNLDFSEFLNDLAYENTDAELLALVQDSPRAPHSPQVSGKPAGTKRRRGDDDDEEMTDVPSAKGQGL